MKIRKFRETVRVSLSYVQLLAVTLVATVVVLAQAPSAQAQYTPQDVTPVALFDWVTMTTAVLTIMGVALAAVGGYKISIGIGKKVIGWFGGRA
ncbi:MAG: hypothetical protein AAF333_07485 [Planctomycetota bacterium]